MTKVAVSGLKIALVASANKGIGLETARRLGEAGNFCGSDPVREAACPVETAAVKLRGEGLDARAVVIDVTDGEPSVPRRRRSRLNSAASTCWSATRGLPEGHRTDRRAWRIRRPVRRVLETNFLGTLAVVQAMLPLSRRSAAGTDRQRLQRAWLVDVERRSGGGRSPAVKLLGYNASKAALNMLTVQLAHELRGTAIKVNAADPGFTATDLNGHRGHQTVEEGARASVRLALLPDDGPSGGISTRRARCPGDGRPVGREGARRPVSRVLSAWSPGQAGGCTRDDHSSGTRVTVRLSRPTRAAGRECPCVQRSSPRLVRGITPTPPPLFGLAPGGVYPAAAVTGGAVRSYRTVSPLPAWRCHPAGGLFSVALSLGSPPPAVSRHRIPVEPGLSSARSPGRAGGQAATVRPSGGRDVGQRRCGRQARAGTISTFLIQTHYIARGRVLAEPVRQQGLAALGPSAQR